MSNEDLSSSQDLDKKKEMAAQLVKNEQFLNYLFSNSADLGFNTFITDCSFGNFESIDFNNKDNQRYLEILLVQSDAFPITISPSTVLAITPSTDLEGRRDDINKLLGLLEDNAFVNFVKKHSEKTYVLALANGLQPSIGDEHLNNALYEINELYITYKKNTITYEFTNLSERTTTKFAVELMQYDGECGYEAYGVSREVAYRKLYNYYAYLANEDSKKDRPIHLLIKDLLKSNNSETKNFIRYIDDFASRELDNVNETIKRFKQQTLEDNNEYVLRGKVLFARQKPGSDGSSKNFLAFFKQALIEFINCISLIKPEHYEVLEAIIQQMSHDYFMVLAYLGFDIHDKNIHAGYADQLILYELALLDKVRIHIYNMDESNTESLQLSWYEKQEDFILLTDPGSSSAADKYIVFYPNKRHFDRLIKSTQTSTPSVNAPTPTRAQESNTVTTALQTLLPAGQTAPHEIQARAAPPHKKIVNMGVWRPFVPKAFPTRYSQPNENNSVSQPSAFYASERNHIFDVALEDVRLTDKGIPMAVYPLAFAPKAIKRAFLLQDITTLKESMPKEVTNPYQKDILKAFIIHLLTHQHFVDYLGKNDFSIKLHETNLPAGETFNQLARYAISYYLDLYEKYPAQEKSIYLDWRFLLSFALIQRINIVLWQEEPSTKRLMIPEEFKQLKATGGFDSKAESINLLLLDTHITLLRPVPVVPSKASFKPENPEEYDEFAQATVGKIIPDILPTPPLATVAPLSVQSPLVDEGFDDIDEYPQEEEDQEEESTQPLINDIPAQFNIFTYFNLEANNAKARLKKNFDELPAPLQQELIAWQLQHSDFRDALYNDFPEDDEGELTGLLFSITPDETTTTQKLKQAVAALSPTSLRNISKPVINAYFPKNVSALDWRVILALSIIEEKPILMSQQSGTDYLPHSLCPFAANAYPEAPHLLINSSETRYAVESGPKEPSKPLLKPPPEVKLYCDL